jgi:hypothetical protein
MRAVPSAMPVTEDPRGSHSPFLAGFARVGVAFAAVSVGVATLGALVVRPIADDLVVNAKVANLHGPLPAFGSWMTSWTGYYSEYGFLTGLAGFTRAVGLERYTFAIASVAMVALLVASVRGCVAASRRLGFTRWGWPETLVLTAGLLGGLAGPLQESLHTNLYEALYWASAWASHLVPVVGCPLLIIAVVRLRRRAVRVSGAFVGGVLIAGFGLVETVIVTAIVCAVVWVAYRLGDPRVWSDHRPALTAAIVGLLAGAVLVERMPGTAARARFLQSVHMGLTTHRGLGNLTSAAITIAWSDAKAVVLSPAPVVGIFVGLGLCLAPLSRARADFTNALPVLVTAAWAVVLVSWAAVTVGDVCSYTASWHLLPLSTVVYAACVLTGYSLGSRSRAKYVPAAVCATMVASLAWTTVQTTTAANIAFARARVFDGNVHSVHVALEQTPPQPTIWNAMSVAGIGDVTVSGPNGFAARAVGQWLGIPPEKLVIVAVSPPRLRVF